jgi:hypothetical protein
VRTSLHFSHSLPLLGAALGLCCGRVAAAVDDVPAPQGNFFSTLTQAFKQDFEHQVVRGYFDVGSPPDSVHRYYCVVDSRTGKRQANGVEGEPFRRPDGMTGIKGTAVSVYSCTGAEQQARLVTTGYVLIGAAATTADAPPASPPSATAPASTTAPAGSTAAATSAAATRAASSASASVVAGSSAYRVDVAGVKLGMSIEEVRVILKAKKWPDYHESPQTLGHLDPANATAPPAKGARFVNVIAAWTPPEDGDGEAYEIIFTPVPGRERAMAIIHSVVYPPGHAVPLGSLTSALEKKYGGYTGSNALPAAPTWRIQNNGAVQLGDSCKRRDVVGGLADVGAGKANRPNLALQTPPSEFRYQIDLCGVAIVTEDHVVANDTAPGGAGAVTRYTITAYSPSLGFEGSTAAAQLLQAGAGRATDARDAMPSRNAAVPIL